MNKYLLACHGGQMPTSSEEMNAMMAKWGAWMQEIGPSMIDPGAPLGPSAMVSAEGIKDVSGPDALTGYSIISAESLEAAIGLAKGCPILEYEGRMEVCELSPM